MKFLLFFLAIASFAQAIEYRCIDSNRGTATIVIDTFTKRVVWMQKGARVTEGVYKGVEKAPYSAWKGSDLYQLVQWPYSNDSSWILALNLNSTVSPKITVYFDNDDHPEKEKSFQCYRY